MKSKLICINNGVVYQSASAACKALGLHKTQISHHLAGDRPTAGGYVFVRLTGNETKAELEEIITSYVKSHYNLHVKLHVELDGGEVDG